MMILFMLIFFCALAAIQLEIDENRREKHINKMRTMRRQLNKHI